MAFITVNGVSKRFQVLKRTSGIGGALRALIKPEYDTVNAVNDISFNMEKGELVGYIGPNGAGKSTTIKMLSGILVPDGGRIEVGGIVPYENRRENAQRIGVVFGQRSSLEWDLPMADTFLLYKRMYKIEEERFKHNVDFFIDLLEMKEFLNRPVRSLSLGQKIRANIAVSLLHDPDTLYLDEPTIGLDVVAKAQIRKFVRELNQTRGTTLVLTTHDMDDIESMCDRIIMIDKGRLMFDGPTSTFKEKHGGEYVVKVTVMNGREPQAHPHLRLMKREGPVYAFTGTRADFPVPQALKHFLTGDGAADIRDIQVQELGIEDIVRAMYQANASGG